MGEAGILLFVGLLALAKGLTQIHFWTKMPIGNPDAVEKNWRTQGYISITLGVIILFLSVLQYFGLISVSQFLMRMGMMK